MAMTNRDKLRDLLKRKLSDKEMDLYYDTMDEVTDEQSELHDRLEGCRSLLDELMEIQKLYEMTRPMDEYMKKIHAILLNYSTRKKSEY